jgi:ectoine hydroxylase-related dioxygenase (phytanoyl-CoA dioxygenase family)
VLRPGALDIDIAPIVEQFITHGYARVGHVADDEILEALRQRTDDLMMGRVVHEGMFFQHDSETGRYDDLPYGKGWQGPSLNYRKLEKLELDPLFLEWIRNPLFERIARAILPGAITLYRAAIFNKGARGGSDLPWHQDGGKFWGVDRDPQLQIWTALDDTPFEAGAVEVLPDTHRPGLVTPPGGVVPQERVDAQYAAKDIIALPARAGESLLIHNLVWHRSGRNHSGHPRRAITACYMDGTTKCLRKKHAPRRFFEVWPAPNAK